jgi:hypothetical protein
MRQGLPLREISLTSTQCLFITSDRLLSAFAIFNVDAGSAPPDDSAALVAQGNIAHPNPAKLPVGPPDS